MEMDLVGIKNQNEYYTNHYFASIFKDNAEDTIKSWKMREKEEEIQLPWKRLRDISRQYYRIRDRYLHFKNENASKPQVQELAELYLNALGFETRNSVVAEVADGISVPVYHEETKSNGAPLLWVFLCVSQERGDDILQGNIFEKSDDEDEVGKSVEFMNDDILAKLFFAGEEASRFVILIGINQIALIDRNKWNEKRYVQFMMEDIYSRHEESTFMAMTVLLHKESLCPIDGVSVLDRLDDNSHKHSAGVSDALKYALRECIEILGNEVIYDMKTRQRIDLSENPVDASELTIECLRYMYRFLFMLFIEARPELGYAPMKSQAYVQGYSLEGLRDVCDKVREASEVVLEGYYIDDTLKELFHMTYYGYPEKLEDYKRAIEIEKTSMHDVFTIEALKAHIFDPEYTKLITQARLRNSAMLKIVDLMSISRPANSKERRGRISYSALGINQMGAVYEALLSYRGFIAEETLFEVKCKGEKFNELDVGYFIPERELDHYEEDERARYENGERKGQLRKYEKGTFIYRLAGREREKSASYYTPEVLTKCLVKYALKELLKDKTADEILGLTICEPAMGSAAFLNEAINQLAEAYLNKKQEELGESIPYDERFNELQKVKMFIADRNVYGVDLNPIAVELAEVSLWLNTIYKGAYVPWFGTQLVCGNSLIGARRQVYSQLQLRVGKWYESAPRRIMPGQTRTKKGQHENTKEIYHFLLGDAGMVNYTDNVIKGLEADNIKKMKAWNKEFTSKFNDDDIQTVLRLSETIDLLWDKAIELRKKVKIKTEDKLSVYGHEDMIEGSHLTIREKDKLLHEVYMSEGGENASPYARLKAAMDYWCALWFWPINRADLLPTRDVFFMEMSLILEGVVPTINGLGQMSILDSSGNMNFDESGKVRYNVEGTQLALEFQGQYRDLGVVCLDDLRDTSKRETDTALRLSLVKKIADEQKFQHWELEFADVFEENGGFDLVVGNPPWVKVTWNEQVVLSDFNPIYAIKKMSATEVAKKRGAALSKNKNEYLYKQEYVSIVGMQNFLGSEENYSLLAGAVNLYKCFLPQMWLVGRDTGVSALIHPEGIYVDPQGGVLRENLYPRLRKHFMFANELKLFHEVDHHTQFSLNVYAAPQKQVCFDSISNLYAVETIEQCYSRIDVESDFGIKDNDGNWNLSGHPKRILKITEKELKTFSKIFDVGKKSYRRTVLPAIQTENAMCVLSLFAEQQKTLNSLKNDVYTSGMWHETNAQQDGTIKFCVDFPKKKYGEIYSGAHIGLANPLFQTTRRNYRVNSDYDKVDLTQIPNDYQIRVKYAPACSEEEYMARTPKTPWGTSILDEYRLVNREMVGCGSERTLVVAIIPPGVSHVNTVFEISIKDPKKMVHLAGYETGLPYDFLVKSIGKNHVNYNTSMLMPIINSKFDDSIMIRTLMLNCLTNKYAKLWKYCWSDSYKRDDWAQRDTRLDVRFKELSDSWNHNSAVRNDYARRELLIEIDVLVAMALGMSLEQLKIIYETQFPVLRSYEEDTWYDSRGRIVFTNNRGLTGGGVKREEWDSIKNMKQGIICKKIEDDTMENGPIEKKIEYIAPFIKCNRERDYEQVWNTFQERWVNG